MQDGHRAAPRESIAAWTKRCYFAGRAVMDLALRPFDLGSTQWFVLGVLVTDGPSMQRDLVDRLQVERSTMSGIVAALLRKGLVKQVTDKADQRRKLLQITRAGAKLWAELPDLTFIHSMAFDGVRASDVAIAIRVLQTATERLEDHLQQGGNT